ncbi:hypothetical protein [Streptosporangium vulgare]|uniref:DUF1508 domain-containing protein n=1 Tax=Streptosporangium vulgare TaxID=46190 RepID=A0ABV5TQ89_9ACTN
MTVAIEPAEVTARDLLAQKFPGWTIWRSNTGRWYATRHAWPTEAEGRAGCARTINAATPADLSQLLVDQEECAERAEARSS